MTTSEIRALVHSALGELEAPAGFTHQVARRLSTPAAARPAYGPYRLAAGVVAILLVEVLLLTRLASGPLFGVTPAPAFKSNQIVGPADPDQQLPPEDLAAAGLTQQ